MNLSIRSRIIIGFLCAALTSWAGEEGKTSATVNGVAISQKKVHRETNALIPQESFHATVSDEKRKELEKKAVENLINKELLLQYAKTQNIIVTQKEMLDEENRIVKSLSGQKKLETALGKANLSLREFREEIIADLTIQKLYEQKIKMTFSEDDLKEYYDKNKYKFKEPEKINVQMIYTRNDPEFKDGRKVARKRVDEAMSKLKAGEDFGMVASKYSNDMSRIKGGDLGLIHKGRIENAAAEKVAFALKKGEMSNIVETDIGCFIFRVKERKEANQLSFNAVKESLKEELKASREKEKMDNLLEALKKQAKIKK